MDDTNKPPAAPSAPDEYGGPGIKWDELVIRSEAAHFPDHLRDDYIWLKTYTRDELNREVDELASLARRLGMSHDKTTWSRILRGRWNRNRSGDVLANPIVSAEKLQKAIQDIRRAAQAESARGKVPFIMTSVAQSMFDFVDTKRSLNRANRFGIIVGPTGSGKTAAGKEYTRQRNHGTTSWMEAPAGGTLAEFASRMSLTMGLAVNTSLHKKRAHIMRATKESKCWWIDNAQDLWRQGTHDVPSFTFLRQLQDETNCTVILSITPTFETELVNGMLNSYWEQFIGRSGGTRKWLRLPDYPPEDDVLSIAQAFGLKDAQRHLKKLLGISREPGRIRVLFDDLQDAKRLSTARKEPFTIAHVEEVLES